MLRVALVLDWHATVRGPIGNSVLSSDVIEALLANMSLVPIIIHSTGCQIGWNGLYARTLSKFTQLRDLVRGPHGHVRDLSRRWKVRSAILPHRASHVHAGKIITTPWRQMIEA